MINDLLYIIQWWSALFAIGIVFLPLSSLIFKKFTDLGYIFSKVLGIALISYIAFLLATLKILQFNTITILLIIWVCLIVNLVLTKNRKLFPTLKNKWRTFAFEEFLFFIGIVFWSYIRAHEPSINGLEKFMDFGFLNSILRSTYLPAPDMWLTPFSINYYYFGYFSTAVITKLSFLQSNITYNLMIATLFSFAFTLPFSLVLNLIDKTTITRTSIFGGVIAGLLVAFSGNLHTIYSLFASYDVDHPLPFWMLSFLPESFPNAYWYPNATRFIILTIHEFPLYSFVVSDLHPHVIDIMYALLGIALTYVLILNKTINKLFLVLLGFLIAVVYMTNAWDGFIYGLLISTVLALKNLNLLKINLKERKKNNILKFKIANKINYLSESLKSIFVIFVCFVIFSLPFNLYFKPFASGIGIICAPDFLVKLEKLGPFLFEADHCQSTPWWQFIILYGFFYFFVFSFLIFIYKKVKGKMSSQDLFVLLLIFVSTLLIVLPEFIYVKDIYPAHYRANTMFKLVYQAFIMLSLSSAYILVRIIKETKNFPFYIISALLITGVLSYPYFAINSYYANLKEYKGIDGILYLATRYPDDYKALSWINENIKNQPVIVEAQGDSYTDYARISSNTGLPTILGWTVHEWLWRGTYDIPAPRIEEVKTIYESRDIELTKSLLNKYNAEYIYVGGLEKEKYPSINEEKFKLLGDIVFTSGTTRIFKLY